MNAALLLIVSFQVVMCLQNLHEKDDVLIVRTIEELRSKQFWMDDGQRTLQNKLKQHNNKNPAKNVIFFIGDGMSIPTVTASRIYEGQQKGIIGERNKLSFENFPYVGLAKTYCVNKQVSDSACTASAYLNGVKANYLTIGVTANVTLNDCQAAEHPQNQLRSIAGWAVDAGKAAGIVTTTRVTHASPSGAYSHTSNRDFESDYDVKIRLHDPAKCPDIARQLIENDVSKRFNVILGGGTKKFLPNGTMDDKGNNGERLDGRNLLIEWALTKDGTAKVVHNRDQLLNAVTDTDYLLGLFSPSHLAYHLDSADSQTQPTLEEMTEVAIKVLQKNGNGFFLFVEGGRIDHAHHETRAKKALDETVEFSKAIQKAYDLTSSKETLIVVSADHGHTMTINGYPDIDNSITGLSTENNDIDGLKYSTLSYANGPGFGQFFTTGVNGNVQRVDIATLDYANKDFQYPASVPMKDETHGGGDVAVYANGPWAHLFSGVMEQSALPALMGFASCLGPGLHSCSYKSV